MWIGDFRFLALLGMTRWWDCLAVTLAFDSSPIKEEGDDGGCFILFTRVARRPSGLQVKSAMAGWGWLRLSGFRFQFVWPAKRRMPQIATANPDRTSTPYAIRTIQYVHSQCLSNEVSSIKYE